MKRTWLFPLGIVLILLGGLWAMQGFGWLKGSAMTGQTLWAVVGPIVLLLGVGLVVAGVRRR
jgi:hypothetical protein